MTSEDRNILLLIEGRLERIESRQEEMSGRLQTMERRQDTLELRMVSLESKIDTLQTSIYWIFAGITLLLAVFAVIIAYLQLKGSNNQRAEKPSGPFVVNTGYDSETVIRMIREVRDYDTSIRGANP